MQADLAAATHAFHRTKHNYLSFSQLADWLRCRYRWKLRYHDGLHPRQHVRPLTLGDAVHQAIAEGLAGGSRSPSETVEGALRAAGPDLPEELYDDVLRNAPAIAQRALDHVESLGWEAITINGRPSVEIDFQVPLPGFDGFIGHFDAIVYDRPYNTLRVVDWKVRKSFMDERSESTNLQHAIYQWLARANGIPVTSSVTFQLKNETPRQPKVNKNGTLSRTAIVTDWPTYRQAVVDAGQDPADYADMEAKLSSSKFSEPIFTYREDQELINIWKTIVLPVADEIAWERSKLQEIPDHVPVRSQNHLNCAPCPFREVCHQKLAGYDTSPLEDLFDRAS